MSTQLENEFTVPVPIERAWPVLVDVEQVAPCMPGATLDSVDDGEFSGRIKVKVGPITVTYKGSARFVERNQDTGTVVIEGSGKEARGSGTAKATVRAVLYGEGASTRVRVATTLNVTGRVAQFGRGVMADVSAKLADRFAANLAERLTGARPSGATAAGAEAPAAASAAAVPGTAPGAGAIGSDQVSEPSPSAAEPGPRTGADAPAGGLYEPPRPEDTIDVFDLAGGPVVKRVVPAVLGALVLLWLIRFIVKRRRG
ncbi:SRPBCC family protein [Allonocardiopsis opalescens]|uniref:Carbon monoxide dehydrogenase subunit G n=1 Tax=Allonocardiopsis opalescens TaxID=1144618 RepID=A0A2T0Q888_9ACTN|nr:SRPBCC family protein [Allonocardiopsis opalescens]PRY00068.1 carbon monoxide dehydrogenase subunit G [Allonocardiopsis opalescens]